MLFSEIRENPSRSLKNSRSIIKVEPASAPLPKGITSARMRAPATLSLSLLKHSSRP